MERSSFAKMRASTSTKAFALALALRQRTRGCPASTAQKAVCCAAVKKPEAAKSALADTTEQLVRLLKHREPQVLEGVPTELHWLPPHVPAVSSKGACWELLGYLVQQAETNIPISGKVDGSRWLSLRLERRGYRHLVQRLQEKGITEAAEVRKHHVEIMRCCCKALMEKFHAAVGYTQCDEMTVVIAPSAVSRGEKAHPHKGGAVQLCTEVAGLVTALFNAKIAHLFLEKGMRPDACLLSHFDCRLGHYGSWAEARSVLLWRAFDCSVNAVSDAVLEAKHLPGADAVLDQHMFDQLRWLAENELLPLSTHQATGSYFVRRSRTVQCYNHILKAMERMLRSRIDLVECPVLELARMDALCPEDND
eukprot:TRINITY_DN9752_c0_g1_i1.p1 TRINITY_DN9752_c0_g1~~TRINITY_DN9752_c0_g1_i1.p1  ORF type:complete len:365 (+),score=45.98 TRINITY_DN9752_c0_g1_i1:61-1155(+)